VAIGGRATRIKSAGVHVPVSKSFLPLCGKPLLHWNLLSLHSAGIRRLILCGNDPIHLSEAEVLLDKLSVSFAQVELFEDAGLGAHGLPFQVLTHRPEVLDDAFLAECGHSIMTPDLYRQIAELKAPGNVVLTAFKPHPANLRQPVVLDGHEVRLTSGSGHFALAHPAALDWEYAARLPQLEFRINRVIESYSSEARLRYAKSEMPPEFDVIDEMTSAFPVYRDYLRERGMVESTAAL
jgi:hypothetical protein